eukprot:243141_1
MLSVKQMMQFALFLVIIGYIVILCNIEVTYHDHNNQSNQSIDTKLDIITQQLDEISNKLNNIAFKSLPINSKTSTSNVNIIKYKQTNFNFFCDYNPNKTILFTGTHHKTGTFINSYIINSILTHWTIKCLDMKDNVIKYTYHTLYNMNSIGDEHINVFGIRERLKKWQKQNHFIVLHYIRKPIDTILSGYNYHKICDEFWTQETIVNMTYKINFCNAMHSIIKEMNMSWYINNSLQDVYNNNNISIGIQIEYNRYIECEFKDIDNVYHYIKDELIPKYVDNKFVHLINIRLENFGINYNETVDTILDTVGILDQVERNKLKNTIYGFSINHNHNVHITKGTYDRKTQIHFLLKNKKRCDILKTKTLSLDYNWEYNNYC